MTCLADNSDEVGEWIVTYTCPFCRRSRHTIEDSCSNCNAQLIIEAKPPEVIESNETWHTEAWIEPGSAMDVETINGETLYAYGWYARYHNARDEANAHKSKGVPTQIVKFSNGTYHVYTTKRELFNFYGRCVK